MYRASTPAMPYKPKRWIGFLTDIKEESSAFKQVLKDASTTKEKSNQDFQKFAQKSFNTIHNSERKKADPSKCVPRLSRPRTRKVEKRSYESPFEYEIRVANHDKWPKRPSSAHRVLRPIRLNDYPDMERPKDIICVMGAPMDTLVPM